MKKLLPLALFAALAGCCSCQVKEENGHTLAYVENNCCKLFCCLPIASGDIDYPNEEVASWWENEATLENNLKLLDDAAREHGASSYRNLQSYRTEENLFFFILKRYTYHTSAELVK